MTMQDKPVWFITGCSTGFGREISPARCSPGAGAPSSRPATPAKRRRTSPGAPQTGASRLAGPRRHRRRPRCEAAVAGGARRGSARIDVLVNNAGYGYQAARSRRATMTEIRAHVRRQRLRPVRDLTRAVLPGMRQRSAAAASSTSPPSAGFVGNPAAAAIMPPASTPSRDWTDALAAEDAAPLGIKVTWRSSRGRSAPIGLGGR